jgi:hypothetical protein
MSGPARRRYSHLAATVELPRAREKRRVRALIVFAAVCVIGAIIVLFAVRPH